jgi:hypothetical protein
VESGNPVAFVKTADEGVPSAGVTKVGLVARTTVLPVPVVVAAPIAVPFPAKTGALIVVERVSAGVEPPEELPERPFAETILREVIGAVPLDAAVIRPLALTVIEALVNDPTFEFTVPNVNAALPGPEADPSPVRAVM